MKENYNVTIGYKAVITISVKADSEELAREQALKEFKKHRDNKMYGRNMILEDDTYGDQGVLNMDKTWNQL